jgi:SH3-like domain-containing protein
MPRIPHVALVLLLLLGAGCTRTAPPPPPSPTIQLFTPAFSPTTPTLIPSPAATALAATATSVPTLPTGPFTPFIIQPSVDSVRLRVGPGLLFDALRLVFKGDKLTVQGRSPGGEWIWVETTDGTEGWIFRQVLQENAALDSAPVKQPEDVELLEANVADSAGVPISGLQFSLTQGDLRTDAVSDSQGSLYFFLPADTSGDWVISYTAISCDSNAYTDSSCSAYKPGYSGSVQPDSRPVSLPDETTLTFLWQ